MRAESNHREIILSRAEISEGARAQGKKRLQSCLAPPRELCSLAAPRASKKSFARSCTHKLPCWLWKNPKHIVPESAASTLDTSEVDAQAESSVLVDVRTRCDNHPPPCKN